MSPSEPEDLLDTTDDLDEDETASPPPELALASGPVTITVEARAHGWRVDHYLSRLYPNFSRSLFQKAIEAHGVFVNGIAVKMSKRLHVNDIVAVRLPELPDQTLPPEDLPIEVIYEDDHLVAINKAAGMIVHPGKGHYKGTLAAAVQFHFDTLSNVAGQLRPGIVHRLDRDTSGVILIAKNNQVHDKLSSQFERREVHKEYHALTWGVIDRDRDLIQTHVRVNPKKREAMMVCEPGGNAREAVTLYEVLERFYDFTYVKLHPKTGRTHQLRVHLKHLGHPIIADKLYGGRARLTKSYLDPVARKSINLDRLPDPPTPADTLITRQALHARRIEFAHPATGELMAIEAPLPADMQQTLDTLRATQRPSRPGTPPLNTRG